MTPARQGARQRDPIQLGVPRQRGHAALRRGDITQGFHEQARVLSHVLNRRVQIRRDVFRRLEILTRLMDFDGYVVSPVCTPASRPEQ